MSNTSEGQFVKSGTSSSVWGHPGGECVGCSGHPLAGYLRLIFYDGLSYGRGIYWGHEEAALDRLMQSLNGVRVDVVLSDMAPNLSGNKSVDQPRAMYLCELALDFADDVESRRCFFRKVFQGEGFDEFSGASNGFLYPKKQS